MFDDLRRAAGQILSPPFRSVLLRSAGLTALALLALWLALVTALTTFVAPLAPGFEVVIGVLSGIGLFVGIGFLAAPVTSLMAGLFLDEIAEAVERSDYPADPPGRAMPLGAAIAASLRFFALVLLVNLLTLLVIWLPGINLVAFFAANAYLLGREYFELAAGRFHDRATVQAMRSRNGVHLFIAGIPIAILVSIPVVNLIAPLFATAYMVHVHKRLAGRR